MRIERERRRLPLSIPGAPPVVGGAVGGVPALGWWGRRVVPIQVRVDEGRRLVTVTISGVLTIDEILGSIDQVVRHPAFEPGFDVLSDHLAVQEPLTPPQAREMSAHIDGLVDLFGAGRWAVVTVAAASYGMLRMVSALLEPSGIEMRLFASHEDAEAWLAAPRTASS